MTIHNLFASAQALDDEMAAGGTAALPETLDPLEEMLTTLGAEHGARTTVESSGASQ